MAQFVCPFCISTYDKDMVMYVCPDCTEETKPGGLSKLLGRRVRCGNPNCPVRGYATRRVCPMPDCGDTIPLSVLQADGHLPISIVGGAFSGKTNYITVMLQELYNVPDMDQLSLSFMNNETIMHHEENRQTIYENRIPLGVTNYDALRPQIWEIKYDTNPGGSDKKVPTYTFTIFDGAGERLTNMDPKIARYINTSKAILLVMDPLTLNNIRHGAIVDDEIMRNSLTGSDVTGATANIILTQITNAIRELSGIGATERLTMPVAVVLTKFDTILNHNLFQHNSSLKKSKLKINNGRINVEEIDTNHNDIVTWLRAIGENGFVAALNNNFETYRLFGVSCYGKPPESATSLPPIKPHRVLDPILWLFKSVNYID